jgi:signal transduction histidine kinase
MRRRNSFFWKLWMGNVLLLTVGLVVCIWLILAEFDRFHTEEIDDHLRAHASTVAHIIRGRIEPAHAAALDQLVEEVFALRPGRTRLAILLPDGRVLADSYGPTARDTALGSRPEVAQALRDGVSGGWQDVREAGDFRFVAVRVGGADNPEGVVLAGVDASAVGPGNQSARRLMGTVVLVTVLTSVVLALALARLWINPIRQITQAARNLSRGDLTTRAEAAGGDELGLLATSLNRMRDRLAAHVETIDLQRRHLEALVAQVQDGIVVADAGGRIVLCNPTAARMLHASAEVESTSWVGRTIEECVPQHGLQKLLLAGSDRPGPAEQVQEIRLRLKNRAAPVSVLARAMNIALPSRGRSAGGDPLAMETGRIMSLTDITQLDRIIQMRTDFVANASHELRTPLSVIRTSVETLRSIDLASDAATAARFVETISRHTRRLEDLVNDLLDLSRVESPGARFKTVPMAARVVLTDLQDRYKEAIATKALRWESRQQPPGDETFMANRQLLDLVLDNLVSNAIKFTDPGGTITASCTLDDALVTFAVTDTGCGIPPEEQSRIFERFYQVERSRTGAGKTGERGTGLGLSIVRHAAGAMQATIRLESEIGRGTRVAIMLPRSPGPHEDASAASGAPIQESPPTSVTVAPPAAARPPST